MQYLLLVLIVVAALIWVGSRSPQHKRRIALLLAVALLACGGVYLLVTGKGAVLFALFAALLPFGRRLLALMRWFPLLSRLWRRRRAGKPADSVSEVVSDGVRMTLNQVTGEMDGEVLQGRYQGSKLSELGFEKVVKLFDYCPEHQQDTRQLLKAYLERMYPRQWEDHLKAQSSPPPSGDLSRRDAYRILGLTEGATRSEILEAHRRLISRLHPDKGGSAFLAAQLNEAKERLLEETR
ncbi:DnaJ domain-containing protein [Aestuariirhabdus litorea]|uniref:Molecular chaperone DnaJ n=1 Tax=Aestuariirhabdus litorea TaxID=2528527 RepID=A0A3P3VTG8_9GAMM|nr:DnaJ domain-containing protein [Aestuariirhabdus litorea]RRJ84759.1 molecular chaperone DnaJ [Aestuariirhabdus litorea]RWW97983.1 molecular chaperone DnaJ [Endozoicomonadaceae bacterium GTF-13]